MDVTHLRTLRELRDRGSVTAVAQALHISASAVSQQLAALQRSVGIPLTRQHGRVLALTPAGGRLAEAAGDVLGSLVRAREALAEFSEATDDVVSITAFHSAGLAWFAPLIQRSLAADSGPRVHCRDEDVSVTGFVDLVADNDLVIAHRPFASDGWPVSRATVTPLVDEPIDLAMRADHPLASLPRVRLSDLAGQTWLAAHEGFALEPLLVQALAATTGEPMRIAHRVNEFNVAAAIIAETQVIGLLPRHTGRPASHRSRITLRPVEGLMLGRHIDVLSRPDSLERLSVRTALDWVRESVAETVRTAGAEA